VTLFQAEDDRLAGLLHPIRRCPEDILRLIFESAVDPLDPFLRATTLSHVCQSWRSIALNTVSLWNIVVVFMDMETDVLKSFIQFTKRRVKSASLKELEIQVMEEYSPEFAEEFIKLLGLKDFTKIAGLNIIFEKSAYITLLPHFISHFPPSSSLDSICIQATTESFPPPSWDCSGMFNTFPSLTTLSMTKLGSVILGGTDTLPQLQALELMNVSIPSLTTQFNRLIALKRLKVTGKAFQFASLEQDITFPMLEELEISSLRFPWDRITAPKLWKVIANEDAAAVAFFGRHPTLRHLTYLAWIDDNEFDVIAKALVNLEHLDAGVALIRLCRPLNSNSPILPLQKLRHLDIEDTKDDRVSLEDFEELVRSRCQIQRSHGRGDLVMLETLFIMINVEELDSLCWRKSSLLTDVRQIVSIWESDNSLCTVELRWLE
jgi:hypothetical protein